MVYPDCEGCVNRSDWLNSYGQFPNPVVLFFITIVKSIAEIALLSLAGRGLLAVLAGQGKATNVFYQVLVIITQPFVTSARLLAPRVILDRHIPLLAFLLLLLVWVVAFIEKVRYCLPEGVNVCR